MTGHKFIIDHSSFSRAVLCIQWSAYECVYFLLPKISVDLSISHIFVAFDGRKHQILSDTSLRNTIEKKRMLTLSL